jgi:hypothetical protein
VVAAAPTVPNSGAGLSPVGYGLQREAPLADQERVLRRTLTAMIVYGSLVKRASFWTASRQRQRS